MKYMWHNDETVLVIAEDPIDDSCTIISVDGIYESVPTTELLVDGLQTKKFWVHLPQISSIEDITSTSGDRTRITMAGWHFDTPLTASEVFQMIESLDAIPTYVEFQRIT